MMQASVHLALRDATQISMVPPGTAAMHTRGNSYVLIHGVSVGVWPPAISQLQHLKTAHAWQSFTILFFIYITMLSLIAHGDQL